jgi:hypothetical protein
MFSLGEKVEGENSKQCACLVFGLEDGDIILLRNMGKLVTTWHQIPDGCTIDGNAVFKENQGM